MAKILNRQQAFGAPGIEPHWTHSNKDGVGTAYSTSSKVWFTLWRGILTEVYSPFIDQPQVRDLQYLITDGHSYFHEEKRDLKSKTEQVWDSEDIPDAHMYLGRPTGAVMPLMWAHAEYTKLLRSVRDGRVFDYIPEVGDRYLKNYKSKPLQVWKFHRQVTTVDRGNTLRIQTDKAFKLRWTQDEWKTKQDFESTAIAPLNLNYVDLECNERSAIEFTFFWTDSSDWSECNYTVKVI